MMSRFLLEVGNRFLDAGKLLRLVDIQEDNILILEEVKSGNRLVVSRTKIESRLLRGEIILEGSSDTWVQSWSTPLDMLTLEQRETAERRLAYVEELEKQSAGVSIRLVWKDTVEKVAKQLGDPSPPGRSTVCKWHARWRKSNKSIGALVDKSCGVSRPTKRLSAEVRQLVLAVLYEKYLVREQPTLIKIYRGHIITAIKEENAHRAPQDRMKVPSRASVYRLVDEIDPYERMARREGKDAADAHFRNVGAGLAVEAPMDCIFYDHTEFDIKVIAPVEGFVARPTLTIALDLYSRMPWGIYLGYVAAGYESVMLCTRTGILPKDALLAHYNSIDGDWPCHGLPREIILDNGLEFHSESLRDFCRIFNVNIMHNPVRRAHYKAAVERFFRTVNDGFLSGLKGRTFSNIQKKGDYDPVKNAVYPFEVFREAFFKWIVDVYARDFHSGINDTPVNRWKHGVEQYPLDLPLRTDDLHILLGEPETRQLDNTGIRIFNARYNCAALNDYFSRTGEARQVGVKVDPTDIGQIYVFDEDVQQYIEVPCTDADYQRLSKWQYKVMRKEVNARKAEHEEQSDIGSQIIKIDQMLEAGAVAPKRKSDKRAARHSESRSKSKTSPKTNQKLAPPDPIKQRKEQERLLKNACKAGWGKAGKPNT